MLTIPTAKAGSIWRFFKLTHYPKFDIVKYVIDTKMAERDVRAAAEEKAATKQKLLAKLAEKQDKALDNLSEEEIKVMIAAL